MGYLIEAERSIIPACDVNTIEQLRKQVQGTNIRGVYAYKVGFDLGLGYPLKEVVDTIKSERPDSKVIFDLQKAGTDVPFTGEKFARRMKDSGVDAAILFPRKNDVLVQYVWTNELLDKGVIPIIGGHLTHMDFSPELEQIYINAIFQGVKNFVVPGNQPESVGHYTKLFKKFGIEADEYSPGFVNQGGDISESGENAGERWHAICGRATYDPNNTKDFDGVSVEEIREATEKLTRQLFKEEAE